MIKLNSIFKVEYGNKKYESKGNLINIKNGIPLISSKGTDNGVHGFYDILPDYEYVLTIARTGTVGATFFHKYKCSADNNVLVLTPLIQLTENEMFYYAYLIGKESYKYLYGRQVTPKRLGETLIPDLLVVQQNLKSANIPKFVLNNPKNNLKLTTITNKSLFKIKELFEVHTGGDKPKENDLINVNYVNSVENLTSNNGINGTISYNGKNVFQNFISVVSIGEGGTAFYQEKKAAVFTRVKALVPLKQTILNKYTALYIITILNADKYRYSYGRVLSAQRLKDIEIQLPSVVINGLNTPDWKYMENYIKSLEYSSSI